MVANLLQNTNKRPIVAAWLPALLRQGVMWLLYPGTHRDESDPEERWLLDSEARL